MSVAAILANLRALGADLRADGSDLRIRASKGSITPELVEQLRRHKGELLLMLEPGAGWDADGWRAHYHERAAIAEHDGGMSRVKAEQMAWEGCLVEWQRRHPPAADPASCAACGAPAGDIGPDAIVLADGATVHHRCHASYRERRNADACAALAKFGLEEPQP